jgi:NADH-quinone oxidoreductase subunit C
MHNQVVEFLNKNVPGANAVVNELVANVGDKSVTVEASSITEVCHALKTSADFQMNVLQAITATDYADRIELSYILASFIQNTELILKAKLPRPQGADAKNNLPKINSVVSVWNAANFQEREAYDMMGVEFVGHPDLRRILCPYDWDGFPLRKDYVVQEKYLDMVVDPPGKNNTDDQMFGKRLKEEIGNPKLVTASWRDSSEGEAEEIKDGGV